MANKPTAILEATSGITNNAATVNGKISDDGGEACDVRFRWREKAGVDGWISPTSHSATWNTPENAYDGDTGTRATQTVSKVSWSTNFDLFFDAVESSKVRVWSGRQGGTLSGIRIHVQKESDSSWVAIYDSTLSIDAWVEYPIGETLEIKGVRIAYYNSHTVYSSEARLHEAEIWAAVAAAWTTVAWDETGYETNDTFFHDLTDLDPDTEYEFQVQARNSAGEGDWSASGYFRTVAEAEIVGAATLIGESLLTAAPILALKAKTTLIGEGILTAAGTVEATIDGEATLQGEGTLTASGVVTRTSSVLMQGEGILLASATVIAAEITGAAVLIGEGIFTASAVVEAKDYIYGEWSAGYVFETLESIDGAANFLGVGLLQAKAVLTLCGSATLNGKGTLTARGEIVGFPIGAAVLQGVGTLTVSAGITIVSAANLDGVGILTALAIKIVSGAVSISGEGYLTAEASVIRTSSATLAGVGNLSASAILTKTSSAKLVGVAALIATAKLTVTSSTTMLGVGYLTASAVVPTIGVMMELIAYTQQYHSLLAYTQSVHNLKAYTKPYHELTAYTRRKLP